MEITEKVHILAVLEKGWQMSINEIRMKLEEYFSLKPKLNALWKNLERCSEQGVVLAKKSGRTKSYTITVTGKKRLAINRIKRQKIKVVQVSRQKPTRSELVKRAVEAQSTMRLCQALLNGNRDQNTLGLARFSSLYWQLEYDTKNN